ncbi:hypothetical protein KJ819_01755 [Patescibacteria group bacterium]|nr:hypothetical protein [Patescibacteria group bacterium]MBU1500991.1 hypothetical protein [Patescibacteria group bacterium]MBU2080621.1 hypothetical protein [Patescibacteria group bacterium]MBU2124304.1 hypothetical protein [Patescibacteria group bacterium]MBU2194430.1 hypothetical protein [Patescibacteria group bacterium]
MRLLISLSGRTGTQKDEILCELQRLTGVTRFARGETTKSIRHSDVRNVSWSHTKAAYEAMKTRGSFLWSTRYAGNDYGMSIDSLEFALANGRDELVIGLTSIVPSVAEQLQEAAESMKGGPVWYMPFYVLSAHESLMRRRWSTGLLYKDRRTPERLFEEKSWYQEARNSPVCFQFVRNNVSPEHTARRILHRLGIQPLS